jgi:glutathione S-transferase
MPAIRSIKAKTLEAELSRSRTGALFEQVRLALKVSGQEFEDVRINFQDWGAMKPSTPFGQLPFMNVGDSEPIAQSAAM